MSEKREVPPEITEDSADVDEELRLMQERLEEMEKQKAEIAAGSKSRTENGSSSGVVKIDGEDGDAEMEDEEASAVDARSVYIGNVDYGATPEEIQAHFQACGTINRVTILCDKFTGHPKGYAYVEFAESATVQNALVLNESSFRGRPLSVKEKRTNVPGMTRGRGRGRGRGYRGFHPYRSRGRGRGRGW